MFQIRLPASPETRLVAFSSQYKLLHGSSDVCPSGGAQWGDKHPYLATYSIRWLGLHLLYIFGWIEGRCLDGHHPSRFHVCWRIGVDYKRLEQSTAMPQAPRM